MKSGYFFFFYQLLPLNLPVIYTIFLTGISDFRKRNKNKNFRFHEEKFVKSEFSSPMNLPVNYILDFFLTVDVSRWYPELTNRTSVIVVEAGKHLLGIYDFTKKNFRLTVGQVKKPVKSNKSISRIFYFHKNWNFTLRKWKIFIKGSVKLVHRPLI